MRLRPPVCGPDVWCDRGMHLRPAPHTAVRLGVRAGAGACLRPAPRYSDSADEHPDRSPPTGVEPARCRAHHRRRRRRTAVHRRRGAHRVPRTRDVGRQDRDPRRVGPTGDRGVHLDREAGPQARGRTVARDHVRPPTARRSRGRPPPVDTRATLRRAREAGAAATPSSRCSARSSDGSDPTA